MPATMAELAPWRVRCTVLSVAYNVGDGAARRDDAAGGRLAGLPDRA